MSIKERTAETTSIEELRINDKFIIPVDSKKTDYQPIHVGLFDHTLVVAKFNFNDKRSEFKIAKIKIIIPQHFNDKNPKIYRLKDFSITDRNSDGSTKKIKIIKGQEVTLSDRNPDSPNTNEKFKFKRDTANKEHIIDIEFKSIYKQDDDEPVIIDYSNHICKFYIV